MSKFPDTTWSLLHSLSWSDPRRRSGLEALCRGYWSAIHAFLRAELRVDSERAADLTQGFFTWLIESPVLDRYDAPQGPFRRFLCGLVRNYARNKLRALRAQKRGGGRELVSLDGFPFAGLPDSSEVSPEEAFDEAWVTELMNSATNRLLKRLSEEGRDLDRRAFEAYELAPPGELPTYASVAREVGLSAGAVRSRLYRVRERLRGEMLAQLRETVSSRAELEAEWADVLLWLSPPPATS